MTAGTLSARGFDLARLGFAFRTALACCLALVIAWAMGLEHPQWAGMSVWAASQPTRGLLLEKSFFRFAGTVSGTVMGVLLVLGMQVHPAILVTGLALWVGTCTWIGNLQRGLVAYGTVLAGYSASMVALLDTAHPDQVFHLGADRLATVLTGVVVATLAGWAFAPRTDAAELRGRVRALLADLLRHIAGPGAAEGGERALLSRLAAVDDALDPQAAGSLRSRSQVRTTRAVLLAAVPLLLWRVGEGAATRPARAVLLSRAADALERGDLDEAALLMETPEDGDAESRLPENLRRLAGALRDWNRGNAPTLRELVRRTSRPAVLHRDPIGARHAGLRAGGLMLLFGVLWLVTGWEAWPFALLGLSVMISVFSTFENPAHTMRHIFAGQVLGVIGALVCWSLLWPFAQSGLQQILLTFPFILLGPLLVSHRATVIAAMDYNLILLLMLQPGFPLTGELADMAAKGLAVLFGPLIAWAGYRLIFPIDLQRRQAHLLAMMLRDLTDIARSPRALDHRRIWQARLYHRALRLVRSSDRLARAEDRALTASLAFLTLGRAVMRCHELLQSPGLSPSARRAARLALERLARIQINPRRAAAALSRLALRLPAEDARLMRQAAEQVSTVAP